MIEYPIPQCVIILKPDSFKLLRIPAHVCRFCSFLFGHAVTAGDDVTGLEFAANFF